MRVAQVWHAVNNTRLPSEQRRGQDRQRRIFRAADLDRTRKRTAAVDEDLIHTWQKGIVSRRYNRSSNKCRGNFFPPEPKEAHLPRRGLFPEPTFHRAGVGLGLDQSAHAPAHRPAHRRTAQLPDHATLRAKECAGLALRYKEDSQQLDRNVPRWSRANDFSETGRGRSSQV